MTDFTVGDVATLDYSLTVTGEPTDATVTLQLTAPDGTSSAPTFAHPTVGQYSADVPVDQAGTWLYLWTASGAATDAENGSFIVRPQTGLSLDELKRHLLIKSDQQDADLLRFLVAAETAIAHHIGPLVPTQVTYRAAGGSRKLLLPHQRVLSLESVQYVGGAAVAVEDLHLSPSGTVTWEPRTMGRFLYGSVLLTYTVGFDSLPEDVAQAVKEFVRHLWATQRGTSSPSGARADLLPAGADTTTAAGMAAYTLPNRVRELLAPYMPQNQVI